MLLTQIDVQYQESRTNPSRQNCYHWHHVSKFLPTDANFRNQIPSIDLHFKFCFVIIVGSWGVNQRFNFIATKACYSNESPTIFNKLECKHITTERTRSQYTKQLIACIEYNKYNTAITVFLHVKRIF